MPTEAPAAANRSQSEAFPAREARGIDAFLPAEHAAGRPLSVNAGGGRTSRRRPAIKETRVRFAVVPVRVVKSWTDKTSALRDPTTLGAPQEGHPSAALGVRPRAETGILDPPSLWLHICHV